MMMCIVLNYLIFSIFHFLLDFSTFFNCMSKEGHLKIHNWIALYSIPINLNVPISYPSFQYKVPMAQA